MALDRVGLAIRSLLLGGIALSICSCGTIAKTGAKAAYKTTKFTAKAVTRTAWEVTKIGGKVATAPLRRESSARPSSGGGGYSYTVHGRRYHVMTPSAARRYSETGTASYYGRESGRQTANGERYSTRAMTAAHKTLPFGTRVRVTNLENGRSAVFRINDRGPFVRGRIIDLTPAGADRLGYKRQGLAKVRVKVL